MSGSERTYHAVVADLSTADRQALLSGTARRVYPKVPWRLIKSAVSLINRPRSQERRLLAAKYFLVG